MAARTCPKCAKEFDAPSRLRRHLARKTPCELVVPKKEEGEGPHACGACNRTFTTKQAKSRHVRESCKAQNKKTGEGLDQKVQALQQQVAGILQQQQKSNVNETQKFQATNLIVNNGPVIQTTNSNIDNSHKVLNNVINDNSKKLTVNQQIANFTPVPDPLPGWPTKWPPPLVDPRPFFASCAIELSELQQAAARLDAADTAACHKGEPRAVSALLIEILRQLHENPEQRNIYLSPDRGDQALVFVPRQWSLKSLQDVTHHIFKQVVNELADLPMQGSSKEKSLAAGMKEGFEKKPQAVVQTSNSAMTAHLKNMEALLRVPGQQAQILEDAAWTAGDESPRQFCHEAFGHINLESTLYAMENDAGVNSAKDVTEDRYAEQACLAIYSLARQVLRWKAKNQTAVRVTNNKALIHTYNGWEERPATEVGEKLFRSFAKVAVNYVEGDVATPLRPLGCYITRHLDELAAEERKKLTLLDQYSTQAERICATSTNPEFAELKKLMRMAKEQSPQPEVEEDILDLLEWTQ